MFKLEYYSFTRFQKSCFLPTRLILKLKLKYFLNTQYIIQEYLDHLFKLNKKQNLLFRLWKQKENNFNYFRLTRFFHNNH